MSVREFEEKLGRADLQGDEEAERMKSFQSALGGDAPQRGPMLAWQMNDDLPQDAPNMSQEPIGPPPPPAAAPAPGPPAPSFADKVLGVAKKAAPYAKQAAMDNANLIPGAAPLMGAARFLYGGGGSGGPGAPPPGAPEGAPTGIAGGPQAVIPPGGPLPDLAGRVPIGTSAVTPMRMGASSSGGYGIGTLQKRVDTDNQRLLGTFDKEKEDTAALGQAQMNRAGGIADVYEAEARRQQELMEHQRRTEADAQARLSAWQVRSAQINDDLRAQKFDPSRIITDAPLATKMSIGLGGILGGLYQAQKGGPNEYMEAVNQLVNRTAQEQQENYNRQRESLKQRDSLYGQMREAAGDERLAGLQYRSGLMEAAKQQIQGQAERLGIPEISARAQLMIGAIDRQQAGLQKEIDVTALQHATSAAQSAQAAAAAREKMLWERQVKLIELGQKDKQIDIEAQKAAGEGSKGAEEARKRTVVVNGPDGKLVAKEAIDADSAKSFREYEKISGEAKRLVDTMQRTQNHALGGAEYDAARAKFIEIMPTLYGYARGPTVAQVEHTFGPESIPNHYTGLNPTNAFGRPGTIKLNDLSKTLKQIDSDIYKETFLPEENPRQMPASVQLKK